MSAQSSAVRVQGTYLARLSKAFVPIRKAPLLGCSLSGLNFPTCPDTVYRCTSVPSTLPPCNWQPQPVSVSSIVV